MWDVILKIWFCLLIAAILGGIIGWLLKTLLGSKCEKCEEFEGKLRDRDNQISSLKASAGSAASSASSENTKNDAEIAELKKQISSLENDLNICHDRQSTMEGELIEFNTKAAALSSAGAVVSGSDSSGSQSEISALKAKLTEAENENEYLLAQIKRAESGESIKREVPMDQRDDLELINGVGPVLERMLYDLGVYFFKDVALWDAAKVAEMDEKLPRFRGRIEREGWVESAKEEHFKKYGERL